MTVSMWIEMKSICLRLFYFCLIVLGGCSGGETVVDRANRENILIIGNASDPQSIDPHILTGHNGGVVVNTILEGLIAYHPTDDTLPEPGVAESWESFDNHSRWVFQLRKNARWSNGDSVTAHDFVFAFRRMLTPELAAQYAELLYIFENAEAYNRGELDSFDKVGVKAIDDYTLECRLIGPTPYFLLMLKHTAFSPVHPPTILKHGKISDRFSGWTKAGNYVGNGPFVLEDWKLNRWIKVRKNPHYWDHEKVRLDGIRILPIKEQNTEERAYRAGQMHRLYELHLEKIPKYANSGDPEYYNDPFFTSYFYRINTTHDGLKDKRVRQALSLAIDRKLIVENVMRAGQKPAYRLTPDGVSGYNAALVLKYDPDEARRLLAAAGYPNGEGFPEFDILYNTLESHQKIAETIQQMWKTELNINVGLKNQEWKVYLDTVVNMQHDISRAGWIGDYLDPITFLDLFRSTNPNNNTGWANESYDRLIKESMQVENMEEHFRILEKAEALLMEEVPIIPIYWYTRNYLMRPEVKGWPPKLLDYQNMKYVWLDVDSGETP
ncbi:MAG: peptide ABC transporter substrate-binding protein [Verrucomicrobiota bacterium]